MINDNRPNSLLLATFEALLLISLWGTGSPVHWLDGYAMLMSPSKGETAVHGCHCPGDIVVRIRKQVIGSNGGGRVSFLIFPFFHSFSSSHPHIWETSLADRPFKTMELEKAREIALKLPELPNDYLRLQDRSNRQTAKHSRFYLDRFSQSANSSMRGGFSRVKRAILSRVSRMCVTFSTIRWKLKLIPTRLLHTLTL